MDDSYAAWQRGEWADSKDVEKITGLSYEECLNRFEWSRDVRLNSKRRINFRKRAIIWNITSNYYTDL